MICVEQGRARKIKAAQPRVLEGTASKELGAVQAQGPFWHANRRAEIRERLCAVICQRVLEAHYGGIATAAGAGAACWLGRPESSDERVDQVLLECVRDFRACQQIWLSACKATGLGMEAQQVD